jgi:predicted dehydrogenase
MNANEARRLRDAAVAAGVVNVVTFNYRGSSLIQQARSMIAAGELGSQTFIHGQYLQDWLTDDSVCSAQTARSLRISAGHSFAEGAALTVQWYRENALL